jgi:hypothetical protein
VQHTLIKNGDQVRRVGAIQDRLTFQPYRDQLVSLRLISPGCEEQCAGILGNLEQSRDDQRLPDAKRMSLTFGLQPVLEPCRHRPICAPCQYRPALEHLCVDVACLAPCGQHIRSRWPVSGLSLGNDCPVEAQLCGERFLTAVPGSYTRPAQLVTKARTRILLRVASGHVAAFRAGCGRSWADRGGCAQQPVGCERTGYRRKAVWAECAL